MSASTVLLVGGPCDGQRVAALFGDSIIMADQGTGERVVYVRSTLRGSRHAFDVAVPAAKALDGDWLIEALLDGYRP